MEPIAINAEGKRFVLTDKFATGDLCDVYNCVVSNGRSSYEAIFKISLQEADNDLLENEEKILGKLFPANAKEEKFRRFLPRVLDSFVEDGRRVNILPWFNEHRSLAEVLEAFPDGIDFRDMVWMFRRIMHGIGFAHVNHVVHGAIIPPHVLIHPENHGAKIIDWSYAVDITPQKGKKKAKEATLYDHLADDSFLTVPHVKAISANYRDYYPPEVLNKEAPTSATDIYMAAKCAVILVGGDVSTGRMPKSVPKAVRAFFKACLYKDPGKRPKDAWDVHEELDKLLKQVVGKRKYRPFPMPARATA
jgi:serine/threonine protein kinase